MHSIMHFQIQSKTSMPSSIKKQKKTNFMHSYMHFLKRRKSKIHIQTNFMHSYMHFSKRRKSKIHIQTNFMHFNMHS